MKTHYDILGIPEDADPEVIKAAYKQLARKLHPDQNHTPTAEADFKQLQKSYSVISDPRSRREYNAELALAKGEDEAPDLVDHMLQNYGIAPYKKPKKKGKKKRIVIVEEDEDDENDLPPPPPRHRHHQQKGSADFEEIPPGYDQRIDFLE